MRRTWFAALFVLAVPALAQVQLKVDPAHYRATDRINVFIENRGSREVSFCVEYGHMSYTEEGSESTPTPVYIQQWTGQRWDTLMTGPDIGSVRVVESLKSGERREYPFRINAHGRIRLVLKYWPDAATHKCSVRAGQKTARSHAFTIE